MLATLAAVLVLVQAGSLAVLASAFVAVGLGLRQLLLFYPERPEARRAARSSPRLGHAGDAALIGAAVLLGRPSARRHRGAHASGRRGAACRCGTACAVALLVARRALKTAAFPLHGWLTEVMEAPTPVSALLHAGIINAGGFLLIRCRLVQASPGAMAALVMIGGFTALFGAAGDADPERGQDGAGLVDRRADGLHAAAMRAGPVGAGAAAHRGPFALQGPCLPGLGRRGAGGGGGPAAGAGGGARAAARCGPSWPRSSLYAAVAAGLRLIAGPKSPQALALGAILIFGVAYLVAQGLADAAPRR
jgi:NAD(P)H-quinone oxidoreductase subunit 5